MIRIPKRHRVEKRFRIFVLELQLPRFAGIGCFVNPRRWSIADAEDVGRLFIDSVDITKVESFVSDRELLPDRSTINGAQHRRSRATGPCDALTHRTHAAQSNIDATRLQGPMRRSEHNQHTWQKKSHPPTLAEVRHKKAHKAHKKKSEQMTGAGLSLTVPAPSFCVPFVPLCG